MGNLKILHINDSGLNDPRIVNAAVTAKKANYEVFFCGTNSYNTLNSSIFSKVRWVDFTAKAKVGQRINPIIDSYWKIHPYPNEVIKLENQLKKVVDELRPDLIHAHDVFAAHYASSLGIPMVFDDHELYSLEVKSEYQKNESFKSRIRLKVKKDRWSDYEQELGSKHPIITVSDKIAEHHKRYCRNVFVIPNYPLRDSIRINNIRKATKSNIWSVYLGTDSPSQSQPFRNIAGLYNIFSGNRDVGKLARIGVTSPKTAKIRPFGLIPMNDAYTIIQDECHIGLVPWQRHWFHEYCCPNKVYEYAHCGLWLITINDLKPVVDDFGKLCDTFQDNEELTSLLEYYNVHIDELNEKRAHSLEHAQENFIWEKHEQKILEAYKVA